jgi:ABC-type antimicrobial peptide transport system permease subunit
MFSALNVFCLAIGISFCLLIGQYILHEASVNSDLKNFHRHFFLSSIWKIKNTGPEITTVGPLSKELKKKYPSLVSNYYRFNPVTNVVSAGNKHFREDVSIGDTTFVTMYGFPLLYGDPQHAFINNSSAIITEEFALKLFGERNAIGKTVTFTNTTGTTQDYKVSAVLKTKPYNSVNNLIDLKGYAMYIPFEGNDYYPRGGARGGTGEEDWNQIFTVSYIELQPGAKPDRLASVMKEMLKLNSQERISKNLVVNLKPLDSYYLSSNNSAVGKTLSILSLVALSILLLAVINFVNIKMGTSSYRIKEIGLRKVFGGRRRQLVSQYLIESIVLTLFAGLLSILLYGIFRPVFNEVLNTNLTPINGFNVREFAFLIVLVLFVGSVAGIYPAFILSGSNMVNSVKGKLSSVDKGVWMRKSLLVLQFTVAIGVFIFSMTISKQVKFFFDTDLGYNKEQLLVINAFPKQWDSAGVLKIESIRNNLLEVTAVKDATVSFDIPERASPNQLGVIPQGSKDNQLVSVQTISVDEKFASTFGMQLKEGRFFRNKIGGFVTGEAVINESAMKSFGWETAEDKKFTIPNTGEINVVGVVKDFHLSSLHEMIEPLVFFHVKDGRAYRFLTIKLQPGSLSNSIEQVKTAWKKASPSAPFEYFFMDEKLQSMYQSELQLKKAAGIATGLMLLIVLLGIFGVLNVFLAKRTREIALRKVLGAKLNHILFLFVRQFSGLLLIANLIAWPLAYYLGDKWLQQFAYRITQPISTYFFAGIFVAGIALILIVCQCLKVALTNPVRNLRSE